MIKAILSDLSGTFLHIKDRTYRGKLNPLHSELEKNNPNYAFFDYFELDKEYLDLMKSLKKYFRIFMFTSGYIQNHAELLAVLKEVCEDIYNQDRVGSDKNESISYKFILDDINYTSEEVLFIDDNENFINAAGDAGLNTYHFDNTNNLKKYLLDKNIVT